MKNISDKETIKYKKNKKKRKKEKDSNSSKDSLELTIKTYQENNKISQKKMGEGEKIKFFFNEFPINNKTKCATASNRKFQKLNINFRKEREEFDFREILLNYVNQTGRTNEKKLNKKERNSVIYTKPNAILTLNGDSDTNKDEFSQQISESSSESDEKTEKMKNIHKKFFEDKNNKKNGNNNSKIVIFKNETKNIEKIKKIKEITDNGIKKLINSEKNIKKTNKITNSNKIIISNKNTFTTTTNTLHTQNTQDSSFKSLQIDAKKYNYDYLNLSDLSLQKKLKIQNRLNSGKKILEKEKSNKYIEFKTDEENMFDKIKNINISLDVEKSYCNYFKHIINLQKQKNNYKETKNKEINEVNKDNNHKTSNVIHENKRYYYYPDEYYLDKKSDLHSKSHISNFFEKFRKKI
jgi:hypothetical protein